MGPSELYVSTARSTIRVKFNEAVLLVISMEKLTSIKLRFCIITKSEILGGHGSFIIHRYCL